MSAARNGGGNGRVIIIGGGIIGAAIAEALIEIGTEAVIVAREPGGVATPGSFAWINNNAPCEPAYSALRHRSMELWRKMPEGGPVRMDGCLVWDVEPGDWDARAADFRVRGCAFRELSRDEISAMEPMLADVPERAFFHENDGAAEPDDITDALISASGAQVVVGDVTAIETASGRVTGVVMGDERMDADHVVVAAGVGSAELLSTVGVKLPMQNLPGLILRTMPMLPVTRRVILAPGVHFWQTNDGGMLAAKDFGGSDPAEADTIAEEVLGRIAALFPFGGPPMEAGRSITMRPMLADDRPVLGRVPTVEGLHVAVTHSGVTLAPVIGQILAAEISKGVDDPAVMDFRIERFWN